MFDESQMKSSVRTKWWRVVDRIAREKKEQVQVDVRAKVSCVIST